MKTRTLLLAAAIIAVSFAALPALGFAETPKTCSTALDTALPAAWSTWTAPETLAAADTPATQPEMTIGHAYKVTLAPTANVAYAVPLKSAKEGTFGGLFMLTIDKAGTYTVGVDQAAWVDMVRDEQALKSASFGHGPECSTLHKTVDFALLPGHYTLQLSNAVKNVSVVEVVAK